MEHTVIGILVTFDYAEPVNVIEIRGRNTVVLKVQSLYFRRLLGGIFCCY
jgi:hypothetical protein